MNGLFLTGTDTGVGKTVVVGAIAAYLRDKGFSVGVMKPAETGCREKGGELVPTDAVFLKKVSGSDDPLNLICPYRFAEPLAPAVAAKRAGTKIDIRRIRKNFQTIAANHDITLVEGAGGLMVPLYKDYLYLDLAAEFGLPLVIIGRAGLGTINHTLLTVAAARARDIEIFAIILNQQKKKYPGAAELTNPEAIMELAGVRRVYALPYAPGVKGRKELLFSFGKELDSLGFFGLTKKNSIR